MPAHRDKNDRLRRREIPEREGERNEVQPDGGSYGDRQAQYGTGAPRWQEPIPGSNERGEFGAGGEAFGSSIGQGRYGPHDEPQKHNRVGQPDEHPAWQPFGQRQPNPPSQPQETRQRDVAFDPYYQSWGNRAMRQHDEDYRAFREEQQRKLADEFEAWRKARAVQNTGSGPDDLVQGVPPSSTVGEPNQPPDTPDKTRTDG